jgi:hypothetical protein
LDSDPDLANAVGGYYEGRLLEAQHPSFALIAFVGSVESLGAKLYKLQRCQTCKSQVGAAERFRQALRLVMPEEDARALGKMYSPRSSTAHTGRLHGMETAFGALEWAGLLSRGPEFDFHMRQMYQFRVAAKRLLELALTEGLPDSLPSEPTSHGPGAGPPRSPSG